MTENKVDLLDITFTGGEPLLKFNSVKLLTERINILCSKLNILTTFAIITNGTLITTEQLIFYNTLKFDIQISLDGNKELHNRIRFFANSRGTFDTIIQKLEEAKTYNNIHISIRINVSQKNFEEYRELFEFLMTNYPKYRIYIDFVDVKKDSAYFLTEKDKLLFFSNFFLLLAKHNRRDMFNYRTGSNCMVRNSLSFTIDSDLNFFKCYSFVETDLLKSDSYEKLTSSLEQNNFLCKKRIV